MPRHITANLRLRNRMTIKKAPPPGQMLSSNGASYESSHCTGDIVPAFTNVGPNQCLIEALKNRNAGRNLVETSGVVNILWHANFQISNIRLFDAIGRIFFVSRKVRFPPSSENFLNTRGFAIDSILRQVLGPGRYLTRIITGGREEFVTDDENATAQNLAAESNGFEEAFRQQFGNYFGRQKINAFRRDNRLPTDESIIRTFITQPGPTLINNGVVHVLRALVNYWEAIVANPFGVFGHLRMEMLDVCLTLPFHMPVVLLTLANLRGLNSWDSKVLGPFDRELMNFKVSDGMANANNLIEILRDTIVVEVCGGVYSWIDPLLRWLTQMTLASDQLSREKDNVKYLISSVTSGIDAGYNVAKMVNWQVPDNSDMTR